jgi:hypothetical protein
MPGMGPPQFRLVIAGEQALIVAAAIGHRVCREMCFDKMACLGVIRWRRYGEIATNFSTTRQFRRAGAGGSQGPDPRQDIVCIPTGQIGEWYGNQPNRRWRIRAATAG